MWKLYTLSPELLQLPAYNDLLSTLRPPVIYSSHSSHKDPSKACHIISKTTKAPSSLSK